MAFVKRTFGMAFVKRTTGASPFGLTPSSFFERDTGVTAIRPPGPVTGPGPCGRETTRGKVRCSDYRERSGRICGGDPGRRTGAEDDRRGEGSLSRRNLFARRVHSHQGAAASRGGLRSFQEWRGVGI